MVTVTLLTFYICSLVQIILIIPTHTQELWQSQQTCPLCLQQQRGQQDHQVEPSNSWEQWCLYSSELETEVKMLSCQKFWLYESTMKYLIPKVKYYKIIFCSVTFI